MSESKAEIWWKNLSEKRKEEIIKDVSSDMDINAVISIQGLYDLFINSSYEKNNSKNRVVTTVLRLLNKINVPYFTMPTEFTKDTNFPCPVNGILVFHKKWADIKEFLENSETTDEPIFNDWYLTIKYY